MKYRFLILTVVLTCGIHAFSQSITEVKKFSKNYAVSPVTVLEITNKYGKVHVSTADADSVSIEAVLNITAPDKQKMAALLKTVTVDFDASTFFITAKTVFDNQSSTIITELKKITDELMFSQSNIKCDFMVKVPKYLNVKINNKYGDVFVGELTGNLDLKLSNGDFKIETIGGTGNLDIKFSNNGSIKSMNNGTILSSYSDITIAKSDRLNLDTKSSKITISEVNILKAMSRRDKYYISNIKYFYADTYFSDVWISNFDSELTFNMKYGKMNIEGIAKHFSLIQLNTSFTDINLYFPKLTAYKFDLTHKNMVLNYPKELAEVSQTTNEADIKQFILNGKIGKGETNSRVKITCESSSLNIHHQ